MWQKIPLRRYIEWYFTETRIHANCKPFDRQNLTAFTFFFLKKGILIDVSSFTFRILLNATYFNILIECNIRIERYRSLWLFFLPASFYFALLRRHSYSAERWLKLRTTAWKICEPWRRRVRMENTRKHRRNFVVYFTMYISLILILNVFYSITVELFRRYVWPKVKKARAKCSRWK